MSESQAAPEFVTRELEALGIELPPEMLATLARYAGMLHERNQEFNLTGFKDLDTSWRRNIIDSLTILHEMADVPEDAMVVDVGSGGGLPGIPLAICRPDLAVTLLEATGKKAHFLEECQRKLPLPNVRVVNKRAEDAGQNRAHRQRYDAVVCRAVGKMTELLEYGLPLAKVGGFVLAMKGPAVQEELDGAGDALTLLGGGEIAIVDAYPEGSEFNTVLVKVHKLEPTPGAYPRLSGMPRHEPLGGKKKEPKNPSEWG